MSTYIFIKKSDVTQAMLNRSTSLSINNCPEHTLVNDWWLFTTSQTFVILEIPCGEIKKTTIFDNYQWYSKEDAITKLEEFKASQ